MKNKTKSSFHKFTSRLKSLGLFIVDQVMNKQYSAMYSYLPTLAHFGHVGYVAKFKIAAKAGVGQHISLPEPAFALKLIEEWTEIRGAQDDEALFIEMIQFLDCLILAYGHYMPYQPSDIAALVGDLVSYESVVYCHEKAKQCNPDQGLNPERDAFYSCLLTTFK